MQKQKCHWIFDRNITIRHGQTYEYVDAIKATGRTVYMAEYVPFQEHQDYGINLKDVVDDVVWPSQPRCLYGTIGFVQKCKLPLFPGSYGINDNTNCAQYYSCLPAEWMLNSDFVMSTFQVFRNNPKRFFDMLDTDDLFIRPNSGRKAFAGYTVTRENVEFELNSSMQLTSVFPETIILIAKAQNIQSEFRFVVGAGEVIDGSEYRWDRILDIRHDWLPECYELAEKMAKYSWQPDTCYTVDVANTDDGPKIVELNGFSCAGLYACDPKKVFNRVSEIAEAEFYGEM